MRSFVPPYRWVPVAAAWRVANLTVAAGFLLLGASVGAQEVARADDSDLYLAVSDGAAVGQSATKRLWTAFVEDFDARARRSEVLIDRLFTAGSDAIAVVEKTVRKSGNVLFGRDRPAGRPGTVRLADRPVAPIPPATASTPLPSPSSESLDELVARVQRLNSSRVLPAPVFDRDRDRMLVDYESGADPYPQTAEAAGRPAGARHLLERLATDDTGFGVPTGQLVLASSPVELQIAALDGGLRTSLSVGAPDGGADEELGGCAEAITDWDEAELGGPSLTFDQSDRPRRMPDGSVFMPKTSQHLLTIRTMLSCEDEVVLTTKAFGHVIRDPNASGLVQASQTGRIKPGKNGLPYVGMRVRAGQELGVLTPAIRNSERGRPRAGAGRDPERDRPGRAEARADA